MSDLDLLLVTVVGVNGGEPFLMSRLAVDAARFPVTVLSVWAHYDEEQG